MYGKSMYTSHMYTSVELQIVEIVHQMKIMEIEAITDCHQNKRVN